MREDREPKPDDATVDQPRRRIETAAHGDALASPELPAPAIRVSGSDSAHTLAPDAVNAIANIGKDHFATAPVDDLPHDVLADRARVQATWLRMALYQNDNVYWSYNLKTREFTTFYFDASGKTEHQLFENFPQSYIDKGRVFTDSIESFRTFFERMGSGPAEGTRAFVLTDRMTGFFVWAVVSYRIITDKDGVPARAVGIRRNQGRQEAGIGASAHDPIPETVLPHLFCYLQVDLRGNAIEYLLYGGTEQTWFAKSSSYDDVIEHVRPLVFAKGVTTQKVAELSRSKLLARYAAGHRWVYQQLRMADSSGTIWRLLVSANVRLGSDARKPTAYVFASDLDKRHAWESELDTTPVIDEATGTYDPQTARELIGAIVKSARDNVPCAFTVFTMHGIGAVDAANPHAARILREDIAIALNTLLGTDTVVSLIDDRTLAAFIPQATSGAIVQSRLESAMFSMRTSMAGAEGLEDVWLVAATICGGILELDFDAALELAIKLSAAQTDTDGDVVLMPRTRDIKLRPRQAERGIYSERFERTSPSASVLGREDTQFHTDCLSTIILAPTHGTAVTDALGQLGARYDADRVYIMSISDSDRAVSVLFEWAAQGRSSILQPFSKRTLDHFPLIKRFASATEPVLVSKPDSYTYDQDSLSSDPWRFAIVPMMNAADQHMLICFENPRDSLSSWGAVERIAPYLLAEWKKLSHETAQRKERAMIEDVPNPEAFEQAASALSSELSSSMGVLAIDVPFIKRIVEQSGFAAAEGALKSLEQALSGTFNPDMVYRTDDAEVVALCPDTLYDAFIKRCASVRSALLGSHPNTYRIGTAWSDGAFDVSKLAQEARSVMRRDDTALPLAPTKPAAGAAENAYDGLLGPIEPPALRAMLGAGGERIDVYLQPKIDVRTGKLVGAEALARVYDDAGNAHTPTVAIERMEQDGSISQLDYFVFDRALELMDRWREKGLPPVPVSSNFSRTTLLAPSALASILAIMSHYPRISPEMVEVEITETACDLGSSNINRLVGTFRDNGMRVALDDFGSSYSNVAILSDVHFDAIKIDRALVNGLPDNEASRMLVRSVAAICANERMDCIAEGIETKEQACALAEEGCFFCQGFYYDKPMPASVFERKYLAIA